VFNWRQLGRYNLFAGATFYFFTQLTLAIGAKITSDLADTRVLDAFTGSAEQSTAVSVFILTVANATGLWLWVVMCFYKGGCRKKKRICLFNRNRQF